ncbi:MAG TPA: Spy/CpxP family protein refolding chaperone [Burkholderiaceae bacterium]|nr:Spy/CpxP family protein refolding chaperone [Burkholderiaceae bacterium]
MSHFTAIRSISNRWARPLAAVAAVSIAALAATPALAHGPRHGGPGMGPERMFVASPERVDRMVDRMLRDLNPTEEQREQVRQIARSAATDLRALHENRRTLREEGMRLFSQPTVDANAVEALRQRQMALHDQASRRMSQAMVEVSRVLTPEQRQKLAERMQQRAKKWEQRREGRPATPR